MCVTNNGTGNPTYLTASTYPVWDLRKEHVSSWLPIKIKTKIDVFKTNTDLMDSKSKEFVFRTKSDSGSNRDIPS